MTVLDAGRKHFVYDALVRRYRVPRAIWAERAELRAAATRVSMDEREYCDLFLIRSFGPLIWTSSTANILELTREHIDAAFDEAHP